MLIEIAALTSQIAVATLFGSMAFFTGVIAPLVFTKLEADVAGRFIRALFPWYYLVILGCSALATAALAVRDPAGALIMGLVADRENHINGIENFWNQAKRHLRRYNGIPRQHFLLFIKECEWRFNYGPPDALLQTLRKWLKPYSRT